MSETTKTTIISTLIGYVLNGLTINKTVKVSPDADSPESKTINLKISFNNISLQSLVDKAVKSDVIQWQAGARKAFDSLVDGSTVERNFAAPVRTVTITPEMAEQAFMAKLNAMSPEDRIAEITKMAEQAQAELDAQQALIDEEQAKIDAE